MKSIRFHPGSNIFVAAMEVQNGEKFNGLTVIIGMFGVPWKMGISLSRAGSNCFGSPGGLSMKSIRFQPGSNIFVAAMEVQNGEEFNGLTVVIGIFVRSIENGNGSEPGWIELFWVPWRLVNEINQVSARLKHICSRHGGSKWRRIQWPNSDVIGIFGVP